MTFTIPGDPQALKRHRSAKRGERIVQYDPAENKNAKAHIRECWQLAGHPSFKERTALSVTLSYFFPRPKAHYGTGRNGNTLKATAAFWHVSRPDLDNCQKLIADSLNGYAWHDDAQIAHWQVWKTYSEDPRTEVSIKALEPACCNTGCSRCRREATQ